MSKVLKHKIQLLLYTASLVLLLTVGGSAALLYNLLNHISSETVDGVRSVSDMVDTSRQAQVAFLRQVQEWKNILLRGSAPVLYEHHNKAFHEQSLLVQQTLQELVKQMERQDLSAVHVASIQRKHAEMLLRYDAALAQYPLALRADNFHRVDTQIRGIDRDLSIEFDELRKEVEEASLARVGRVSDMVLSQHGLQEYYLLGVLLLLLPGIALYGFYKIGRLSKQLAADKERAQVTLASIGDAVIVTDVQGRVDYMNPVAEKMTGWPLSEARGKRMQEVFVIVNEMTRQTVQNPIEIVFRDGIVVGLANHTALIARDGSERSIEDSAAPVRDEAGEITGAVLVFHDATSQKTAQREIEHLAYHDHLTSLPNRRLLQDRIEKAISNAARHETRMALMFIDLDHFKVINDTLGHEYGDLLLKAAAERLQGCVREQDSIARTGGDEFVVLLAEINDANDAVVVTQKILESMSRPYQIKGTELRSTPSIGISIYPEDGLTIDILMKHADVAMYHVKERGRAGYHFFAEDMNVRTMERLTVESNLHKALEREEFELYYQPKVNMRDGKLVGAEALIRWQHPQEGLISPAKFIPIAEETGIISAIGEWVAHRACLQSRVWMDMGHRLPLSINVSARQFLHGDLPGTLANILRDTGADPTLLELELTEGVLLHPQDAEATLAAIKGMGFRVALDDFGTGYSSLAYLRRMSIDTLKIDRSFVMHLEENQNDVEMVQTIIAMARNLHMSVIAEGVETQVQANILIESGCDECQGYFFGKPQPAMQFYELLKQQ
jgi:diguanylate cyclase (GGDEF)-like protein/PAS domain S-box-containing protein